MMVLGRYISSPDPISRAFFTADTSSALPAWIARSDFSVDSSMPAVLSRLVSLVGVRTRATHEYPALRV